MKTIRFRSALVGGGLVFVNMLLAGLPAGAQVATNWAAFNDHRPTANTGPNVSGYDLRGNADRGLLIDQITGAPLPVRLIVSDEGGDSSDDFGACQDPDPGTPADLLFTGKVDVGGTGGDGIIGLRNSEGNIVTLTFTNLDPSRKYVFLGTTVRGNNYVDRWTIYSLIGADSFVDAHIDGSGNNNLLTPGEFPGATVGPGQVVLNSGENRVGSVIGWKEINPGPDGSFSIRETQYIGATPYGVASAGPYGYGLNAIVLMEVGPPEPVSITQQPPAELTVSEFRTFSLTVGLRGSPPPSVQWYKGDQPIGGNTRTLVVTNAQISDSGDYYAVAQNPINSVTTRSTRVTVIQDTVAPRVVRAVGSATFDKVVVDFDEVVDPNTGGDNINYGVEGPGGALGVSSAILNPGGMSVTLNLGNPMAENEEYRVIIDFVTDLAQNEIPHTEAPFRSWVSSACSGLLFEAYNGTPDPNNTGTMTGNAVNVLTSHPSFPNSPSETLRLVNSFDSGEVYDPSGPHEAYGGRIRGLFVPPTSGAWRLVLQSDDGGELWFNPNGPGATGRQRVAVEAGCCGSLVLPTTDPRVTVPFQLIAGQVYYLEALYKEGGGGDYCRVAAVMDGVTGQSATNPIPKEWLGSAVIGGVAGSFTITQPPADTSVPPNGTRAVFSVGTSTDVPLCYQWLRNGADIPGALGPNYSFVPAQADNGAKFSVRISLVGGPTLTSSEATLTVAQDHTPPVALSAVASVAGTVTVAFSELVDATTAQNPGNYSINGLNVVSATQANGTNVVLVPAAALASCVDHQLRISGVTDGSGNVVSPNPTVLSFVTPIILVANSANQIWRYWDTGVDLGTAWREQTFDDSAWKSGAGVLAAEDPATLPPGWVQRTDLTNEFGAFAVKPTYYFRTHFNLPTHPSSITRLEYREVVDDGAVAYLNGTRVNLNRLSDPFDFNTLSGGAPSEAPHPIELFVLSTSALRPGDNVLAVEVHQSATTSSDIVYGGELVALVSRCGVGLAITRVSANQVRVEWSDPSYRLQTSGNITGAWTTQANINSGDVLNIGPNNLFLRLIK